MSNFGWDNTSTSTGRTDLVSNDAASRSKSFEKTSRSAPSSANIHRRKNYPRASLDAIYGNESQEKININEQDCIAWKKVSQQLTLQLEQKYRSQLSTHRSLSIPIGDQWKDQDLQVSSTTVEDASLLKMDAHAIPIEQLLERFHSNLTQGLTDDMVAQHRIEYGLNKLTPSRPASLLGLFFKQLIMGFNSILWIAALFAFLSYKPFGDPNPDVANLGLGVILILVVVLNALFNFYQEFKSRKIISSFSKMQPTIATVRRNGIEMQLNAEELVPGDIVRIRLGDKIPADCRIISCDDLQVNTSQLTGESAPVICTVKCTDLNFMESTNVIFYSSLVVQGAGEGLVINTGDATVLGQVGKMTHGTGGSEITGLHREINRFVLFIFFAALTCIILLWITWAAWLNVEEYGYITLNGNVVNSIGMVVCFIPEGLPAAVTLVLTIVAKRMYKQKVMVKSLATIETFNSVSVIATDKTGTLTMNEMTITALLWGNQGEYIVPIHSHSEYQPTPVSRRRVVVQSDSLLTDTGIPHVMKDLILGSCLCNNATRPMSSVNTNKTDINNLPLETTQIIGDAADVALYHFCEGNCSVNFEHVRKVNPRINIVPFNSKNKFMITANILEQSSTDKNNDTNVLVTLKGAPDFVLSRCSTYKPDDGGDGVLPMTDEFRRSIQQRQEQFGKSGYRVIAMLQQKLSKSQYDHLIETYKTNKGRDLQSQYISNEPDLNGLPTNNYCFVGMFALLDPARPEVPDVVLKARHASIRVAMVTGDHPTTATAIAKIVNIFTKEISVDNGIDTFQISYNNQTNQNVAYFMRNTNTLLESHAISEVQTTIHVKGVKPLLIQKKKPNIFKRMWNGILFYLRNPNEVEQVDKQEIIPYAIAVTGSDIHVMDDYMWDWVLSHQEIVFARVSPEQKLRIVMEFSKRGEVIAVTGDGTNDAPALKQADLGVAMAAGTDVAKEAGDLILLDNNFASIISAIEMGRLLSENLKKVTIYLLPGGTWSEVIPVLACTWLGIPLSLSLFLGVIFCMFNDIVNSLAMVSEKPEDDIMSRPPAVRHKNHLVDWKLLVHAYLILGNIECFSAYFCFFWYYSSQNIPVSSVFFTYANYGIDPPLNKTTDELSDIQQTGQSIYFVSLCIMQMFNLLSTRTRYVSFFQHNPFFGKARNLTIIIGITFSTTVGLIITLVPWFNTVFKTRPVPVKHICPALGFGAFLFLFDEARKFLVRRYPKSFLAKMAW